MARLGEDARDAGNIVVISEAEEVHSAVLAPVFRAETVFQRVTDLEHIHRIEAGVQTLVALIIGSRMQHFRIYPARVIAVKQLADEEKVFFKAVGERTQALEEVEIKAVGNVQTNTIYIKFFYPSLNGVQNMVSDSGIAQVKLDEVVMTLPALVPQAVVVVAVTIEIDVEPVLIGRIPALLDNVAELRKAPADVVENAVEDDLYSLLMQCVADLFEVLVRAESAVDLRIIAGVVAVCVRLKNGRKVHGVAAELLYMIHPFEHFQDTVLLHAIVFKRRAAKSERIYLVKYGFIAPICIVVSHCNHSLRGLGGEKFCRLRKVFVTLTIIAHFYFRYNYQICT